MFSRGSAHARWAAALAALALVTGIAAIAARPAQAELFHPRQHWLRASTAGLFLHWGMRTSPALHQLQPRGRTTSPTAAGTPDYWVHEAQKLHAQYIVLATFHSRLGYARPWPSKIPGSCSTKRDFLGELIAAADAQGLKVILYMTDDPQWHDEGGRETGSTRPPTRRTRAARSTCTTRDGFGEFSYDNFFEVMQRLPGPRRASGSTTTTPTGSSNGLYEQIRQQRPHYTLSNNNEDTPIMDMISNEQKTGMTPSYDYPQAVYTAAAAADRGRLQAAVERLLVVRRLRTRRSTTQLTLGRLITNAGSSIKALMAETADGQRQVPVQPGGVQQLRRQLPRRRSGSRSTAPRAAATCTAASSPASGTTARTA